MLYCRLSMTRSIERQKRIGYRMSLPSDMHNGMKESVDDLEKLWRRIFREGINRDKDQMAELINDHFESLPEEQRDWLQGTDPRSNKPRSILVKERAMQIVQISKTPLKKRHRQKRE